MGHQEVGADVPSTLLEPSRWLLGLAMCLLRRLKGFIGMFQCLFGMFVSGLVILFPVVRRGGTMSVCGEFVEFGRSLV
jgi:hypothetical protein